MNPIFTLNYPESVVAERLTDNFAKTAGHSVLVPATPQQKGFDLALMRRTGKGTKAVTFQVKSSKGWMGTPGVSKRNGMRTFRHYMWLKRFAIPADVDFFVLLALYAPDPTSLKNTTGVWKAHMLLFTHSEMTTFMASVRLRTSNKPDGSFGFGFDHAKEAYQTRGHALAKHPEFSPHLIGRRLGVIAAAL